MPTTDAPVAPRGGTNSPRSIVTFKSNVRVKVLTPFLARTLFMLEYLCRDPHSVLADLLPPDGLMITSINDSGHMEGSRHYRDEALDLRSHNFPSEAHRTAFRSALERALNVTPNGTTYTPKLFTVLYEDAGTPNAHFHVQVAKGRQFGGE